MAAPARTRVLFLKELESTLVVAIMHAFFLCRERSPSTRVATLIQVFLSSGNYNVCIVYIYYMNLRF